LAAGLDQNDENIEGPAADGNGDSVREQLPAMLEQAKAAKHNRGRGKAIDPICFYRQNLTQPSVIRAVLRFGRTAPTNSI
jgi:hypothetical protein